MEPAPEFGGADAAQWIETAAGTAGLTATVRGSLNAYPGSIHWHFQREAERGTLEVTLWPARERLWFSIHGNRDGAWMPDAIEVMRRQIQTSCRGSALDREPGASGG